ncbi:ferrous iron transport protein A [Candidatus Roizmanbacteria bacterium]|jgi:ferrous iron transport protein A|nr:ferrous iron transport protein A [Candidatus Roizmanbacteria bacterium]
MSPIIDFKKGDIVNIVSIDCGRNFNLRLSELGIYEGAEIKILKNDRWGPLIIRIFDSKIAIGKGEAFKIYGEKKPAEHMFDR